MKKTLALLLSVLLIFGSITVGFSVTASAEGENLWTSAASSDVGNYSGYGAFKSYDASTNTLTTQSTFWQRLWVKLPTLKAGASYKLSYTRSFGTATLNGEEATFRSFSANLISGTKQSQAGTALPAADVAVLENSTALTNQVEVYFNTGTDTEYYLVFNNDSNYNQTIFSSLTLVELPSYDITVKNGSATLNGFAAAFAGEGATVKVIADDIDGYTLENWRVNSGDVALADSTTTTTTFVMGDAPVSLEANYKTELWTNPYSTFSSPSQSSACTDSGKGYYEVTYAWHNSFNFTLPTGLEEGKLYRLSFEHNIRPGLNNSANNPCVASIRINNVTKGTTYKAIASNLSTNATWQRVVTEFEGTADQLALYFQMNYGDVVYLRNFSVIEVTTYDVTVDGGTADVTAAKEGATVTVTATPAANMVFTGWQVISGGVTLADAAAETTTFTVNNADVSIKALFTENLWTDPSDGFYDSKNDTSNSMTYVESDSIYVSDPCYKIANAYWRQLYIKLPSNLSPNATYRLSFDYNFYRADKSLEEGTNKVNSMYLATQNGASYGEKFISTETVVEPGWKTAECEIKGTADQLWLLVDTQYIYRAYFRNFELIKISEDIGLTTAYNSKAAIRAASNTDGTVTKNGLRIYNEIKNEWTEGENIVEYGSLAVRKNYLSYLYAQGKVASSDATLENLNAYKGKGVGIGAAYSVADQISQLWEETEDSKIFTSYLTGIAENNYGEDYLIVAYAVADDGAVYYGEAAELCIYDVAYAIDQAYTADPTAVPATDVDAFNTFVEPTIASYAQWCTDNYGSAPEGNLYMALIAEE